MRGAGWRPLLQPSRRTGGTAIFHLGREAYGWLSLCVPECCLPGCCLPDGSGPSQGYKLLLLQAPRQGACGAGGSSRGQAAAGAAAAGAGGAGATGGQLSGKLARSVVRASALALILQVPMPMDVTIFLDMAAGSRGEPGPHCCCPSQPRPASKRWQQPHSPTSSPAQRSAACSGAAPGSPEVGTPRQRQQVFLGSAVFSR